MFTKPTFENNLYMRISCWLYIGFALNISFWVVNTPYTLTAMFLAVDPRNLLWFALALLLIGPSMISLLAAIDRFAEHKDIDPVKDFCYFTNLCRAGSLLAHRLAGKCHCDRGYSVCGSI